ncbi:MAG TPA: sugar transferase [Anaeromyxobacter sp.]|nr:sugar transferase [Anaeromyxobacter sp.]
MLKRNSRLIEASVRSFDVVGLAAAFPAAYAIRARLGSGLPGLVPLDRYWPLVAETLLLWIAAASLMKLYGSYRRRPLTSEVLRLGKALLAVAIGVAALGYAQKADVSRLLVATYFAVAFTGLAGHRLAIRFLARSARRRGYNTRRYAVAGHGALAREIVRTMSAHPEWGYEFAGYLVDGPPPDALHRRKILGRLDGLAPLLKTAVLDEVIFVVPHERLPAIEGAVLDCEEQGVSARVCMDLFATRISTLAVEDLDGIPLLALSTVPQDPFALAAKRALDVALSALALLALSPVFLAVAIAIRLDSPGPVFFRQRRVGMNGREFTLLKFRSMYRDAHARLEALRTRNEVSGPVFKMRDDPRVTRVGRLIRRTSIDELPQFWNVLRGEMSVVGPRPPLPSEVQRYERRHLRRLSVKPGITCTWQVSGRSAIGFDRWMELDLSYIDNWSLWHDVKILARTIPAVLTGRGAH